VDALKNLIDTINKINSISNLSDDKNNYINNLLLFYEKVLELGTEEEKRKAKEAFLSIAEVHPALEDWCHKIVSYDKYEEEKIDWDEVKTLIKNIYQSIDDYKFATYQKNIRLDELEKNINDINVCIETIKIKYPSLCKTSTFKDLNNLINNLIIDFEKRKNNNLLEESSLDNSFKL